MKQAIRHSVMCKLVMAMVPLSAVAAGPYQAAAQTNAPAILQWFEGSYRTIERRSGDFFVAGYGQIWVPPVSRADSGNQSVGYDVYNHFDLGSPGAPTLYGTETGLKRTVSMLQRTSGRVYLDLVWNHKGFRDASTPGFVAGGGYPGFVLNWPGTTDGDFNSSFASGDLNGRLAGLVDINQSTNIQLIRNPVTAGNAQNIPAGTWANQPTESNRRYYQNRSGPADRFLFDPTTGETNIPVWDFDNTSATQGTPVAENALGYLMRHTQWLVQEVGVDGFRLDATKHMPSWVLNYYDRAVYRTKQRTLLNGAPDHVFAFGEYFDGNNALVQTSIKKNINDADPGRIGGNRDALDFALYYGMQNNLSSNGLQNDWRNMINVSLDVNDDGLANNGSQGVSMVSSHDKGPPSLQNVAYAYTLMRPGNTIVYLNAREFGTGRSFPNTGGRGDALGGLYGNTVTTLVDIRNRYSQGNYLFRLQEKETLVIERQNSLLAMYSNRTDAGFDERTVSTSFPAGMWLVELTGNHSDPNIDPGNNIPPSIQVGANGVVSFRVPRNGKLETNGSTSQYGKGYLIYGPATPRGTVTLSNVVQTLGAETATDLVSNATARVNALPVIKANSFTVTLQTQQVQILTQAGTTVLDPDADGDNAVLRVNSGIDVNGNGVVDFTAPNSPTYGFESFNNQNPLASGGIARGTAAPGQYIQSVDATGLPEGMNFVEVRAFRKRGAGEPAVFSSWRVPFYVDRLAPVSSVESFNATVSGVNQNRRALIRSVDMTANNVHILVNLPASLSDSQVIAQLSGTTNGTQTDRDLWQRDLTNLVSGNHVITVVTFEETGTSNVQRFTGYSVTGAIGAGLGDLNSDNLYSPADMTAFGVLLRSNNSGFNPAADLNGDGLIDLTDYNLMNDRLRQVNASGATVLAYANLRTGIIPEPVAVALLAPMALLASRARRKR